MEIALQIYFAINIFLAGYWFNEHNKWESRKFTIIFSFGCLLFGALICLFFLILEPIFVWTYKEIRFQYRFYFTKYWDKILLDDNYSEKFCTKEEKLERMVKIMSGFSKQTDRHLRQIQNKYAAEKE